MLRVYCRVAFGLLVVAVTLLSVLPQTGAAAAVSDKTLHLVAYFVVTATGLLGWLSLRDRALVLAGTIALGGVLEVVQLFVPGRYGEVADFTANLAGCLLAALAIAGFRRVMLRRPRLPPDRA